jgi:hypothetical protein
MEEIAAQDRSHNAWMRVVSTAHGTGALPIKGWKRHNLDASCAGFGGGGGAGGIEDEVKV